ncbi:MAG: AAA family ATPase [Gammaproteobacteria bacterium]|nr:AAA family ATPase [Gammaproteobacteria bacterium]
MLVPATARADTVATLEVRPVHRRATIDFERLRAAGYLPEQSEERRFADYCHRIKRPLIDRALGSGAAADARAILLSSALPGDGKTFITLNLALSMARERDISVLLVDGDLPRAQITHLLGLQDEAGLLTALRDDKMDVESLIHDTEVSGLEILPAGSPPDGAAELIASSRMREVVARLTARNPRRLLLFDSPPLLVSSEARALVAIPGQIVLVARSAHTPQRAVLDALGHIDKQKLRGLVVNDALVGDQHGYYEYAGYGSAPLPPGNRA